MCVVMCVVMCVHRAVGVGAWVRSRAARAVLRLPRGAGDHAASIGPRPSIHRTSLSTAVEMNGTTIVHYTLRYVYTNPNMYKRRVTICRGWLPGDAERRRGGAATAA